MRFFLTAFILFVSFCSYAQKQLSASEIKLRLKKLNFLGSVLYVAAHPDDENTRVIAYLVNERLASTAYLSMTRGDGGQNLIGPEIRDQLGLIRTQELLAARKIDGGRQFFTRANDFGFSKNSKETFDIWNKDEILSDVVRVFRQYQPDVIITRFPPDERAGHGHHTASAILAQEAFELSAKNDAYPEQLNELKTWQVKRVFTNTGRWWNQTINENTPGVVTLNVGSYNALLGKSYSEIAADSRTQHKSQGFGSPGRRGDAPEYFELAKGEAVLKDIFDGVNTTWSRVKDGEKIQALIEKAIAEYNGEKPFETIPALLQIRKEIQKLEKNVWTERKLEEVSQLVQACAGLFAEVTTSQFWTAPGEQVTMSFEIVNRSDVPVTLKSINSNILSFDSTANLSTGSNKLITFRSKKTIIPTAAYSSPYWLKGEHTQGLFRVDDKKLIGKPENPPAVPIQLTFQISGEDVVITCPLIYKWTDPVKGEQWRPFEITPPVSLSLPSSTYIFKDTSPQPVNVMVKSVSDKSISGMVRLELPEGWRSEPASQKFDLAKRGNEATLLFQVLPSKGETAGALRAVAEMDGKKFSHSLKVINYDHIPAQTLMPQAEAKAVRVDLEKEGAVIGYVKGAGDDVPAALRNMGYEVWEMKNEEVTPENLAKVDAVILGVRALNTNERVRYFMPSLFDYVKNGGTLIAQYNTNFDLEIEADKFSPYALKISRERVTEENSEVSIILPEHPALNYPNKISDADFEGWVQERGLYFPNEWSTDFEAPLSMHDASEPDRKGGLLIAKYGSGYYVYTGLSFFRELPEGVPGAYKLFANLVSLGKNGKPQNHKVKASKK